jgi:hypothetical protein
MILPISGSLIFAFAVVSVLLVGSTALTSKGPSIVASTSRSSTKAKHLLIICTGCDVEDLRDQMESTLQRIE